jgi:hypothetical protein
MFKQMEKINGTCNYFCQRSGNLKKVAATRRTVAIKPPLQAPCPMTWKITVTA